MDSQTGVWVNQQLFAELTSSALQIPRLRAELAAAQEACRQAEERYRNLFENVGEGIFQTTPDGHYLTANTALAKMYGYDSPEDLIATLGDISRQLYVDPGRRDEFIQLLSENDLVQDFESRIYRRNGQVIWISESARAVRDNTGRVQCYVGIVKDITARKQNQDGLRRAKEAAERANRAKSEFLSRMSHELRTPLNAVLGFTQVLLRDTTLTPEQQENLEIIHRSGSHLLDLINDVLEMSKIEAGRQTLQPKDFDIYELLHSLEDMFQLRAETKGLQLLVDRRPDLPQFLQADERKLRQVLINLLGNALKFTTVGGVCLRVDHRAGRLYCEIEDTGPGITEEDIPQLFEAFIQTDVGQSVADSTGLGLPISQQFVRLMGGEISVRSQVDVGTVFLFGIPAPLGKAVQSYTVPSRERITGLAPNQPTWRILAVDDRLENRKLLVKLLTPLGFAVREAHNGQEAIEVWSEWEPHLIWMDMRMPVMDGYEATRRIKAQLKGQATVIIALTASAFEEERSIVMDAGCDDFLRKPFREEVLLNKMAEHLGVHYTYAASGRPAASPASPGGLHLESLNQQPQPWLQAVHQSALEADGDQILHLATQLEDAALAKTLRQLVDDFQFRKIVDATQQALE
ncbi:MAG: response regulator [Gloeomargaritaceae cyanobacterium C42_A2020_066]|nr:response regulator [Gloeomargaritaceae cyanobacterium C42_A2020_066]